MFVPAVVPEFGRSNRINGPCRHVTLTSDLSKGVQTCCAVCKGLSGKGNLRRAYKQQLIYITWSHVSQYIQFVYHKLILYTLQCLHNTSRREIPVSPWQPMWCHVLCACHKSTWTDKRSVMHRIRCLTSETFRTPMITMLPNVLWHFLSNARWHFVKQTSIVTPFYGRSWESHMTCYFRGGWD